MKKTKLPKEAATTWRKPTPKPDQATAAPSGTSWRGKTVVRCWSQKDLDAALKRDVEIWLCGTGRFVIAGAAVAYATDRAHVVAMGSSHVEAWGSSHVVAWESSHVVARGSSHVEAWESSHVVARGSSHVVAMGSSHVEAWGSSHVVAWESSHVVARGSSHVVAMGSSHVEAAGAVSLRLFDRATGTSGPQVVVQRQSRLAKADGGIVIDVALPQTAQAWCDWHGVKVVDGVATVFKTVRDDYRSSRGFLYTPGSTPVAPDWDHGRAECGGGLHASPMPFMALDFDNSGTKFIACPVKLDDMRAPQDSDTYLAKVKFKGVCAPVWECDRYGKPLKGEAQG